MRLFREIPPTAGFPLYTKYLYQGFFKKTANGSLEEDFKNYLGVAYAEITYSGTAAFYLILEALKKLSSKQTVIIPAFICPLVPLAIKRAGLKIAVCDINKTDFNFDLPQLKKIISDNPDILAITTVHLAGIPVDLESIKRLTTGKQIFIIEDCAQGLGARHQANKIGTIGDFAFFSLCRGKGLTIYEGGVLVTKETTYSTLLDDTTKSLVNNDNFSELVKILEIIGYWIFYRPELFWFVFRLPQIYWNLHGHPLKAQAEYFTPDFPIHRVSLTRKAIGQAALPSLDFEIHKQREKTSRYIQNLRHTEGIHLITESSGDSAVYPYLTLLFEEPLKRARALRIFQGSGLGISQIYANVITDYEYLKGIVGRHECPNAKYLADREITLTTSLFLKTEELDLITEIIKKI